MESISSSRQGVEQLDTFTGFAPPSDGIRSCESSDKYDVFINHRGPDVKEILAIPLHDSLVKAGISAYLDKKSNKPGDLIYSKIKAAISSASVHIAIFSPNYAGSVWCLAELTSMLRTRLPIIPVFYDVQPSDVKYQLGLYKVAFSRYEVKKRYLYNLDAWKKSLLVVGGIVGFIVTSQSDMNNLCKDLVSEVENKLAERHVPLVLANCEVERRNIPLEVSRYKVGLDGLVQGFEEQCRKLGSGPGPGRGNMIGIFGPRGSGKTTLAKELFNRKCSEYSKSSFLFNDGEASCVNSKFTALRTKLFRDLFNTHNVLEDAVNGTIVLKFKLKSLSSFLIIVDDVTAPEQVNDLVPLNTINSDSLVIVTAREECVLREAGINLRYEINKMNFENGRQLFSRHAFQGEHPCGYRCLVKLLVAKCGGLPLSLQLLGDHAAFCKNKDALLLKSYRVPGALDIQYIIKLSYDALEDGEKEIFLDIACFFTEKEVEMAKRIWKAFALGWDAERAFKNLRDRCLVDVVRQDLDEEPPTYVLRMHQVLREFGTKEAESRKLRKIKRVWCLPNEILESNNFHDILKKAGNDNFRCLNSISEMCITYFLAHSEKSAILQWLELNSECIPEWIPLQYLEALRVRAEVPKKLWQSDDQASWKLKELLCKFSTVGNRERAVLQKYWSDYSKSLINLCQLECLFLEIKSSATSRRDIVVKWDSFLSILTNFSCLKTLTLSGLHIDGVIVLSNCTTLECLKIENLRSLIELDLEGVKTLKCLEVLTCHAMKRVSGSDMPKLEMLSIEDCSDIEELPNLISMSNLKTITIIALEELQVINGIEYLSCVEDITITCCSKLQTLTGIENLKGLQSVILSDGSSWRCVARFQRLPSKFTVVMGTAATSSLDEDQIGEVIDRADSHREFKSRDNGYQMLRSFLKSEKSFTAIIICAMVSTSRTYMDRRPQFGRRIQLSWLREEEKSIYTIVVTDPNEISMASHSIPGYCWMPTFDLERIGTYFKPRGKIEKGYILGMNKGQECELLRRLIDTLYKDYVVV